MLWSYRTMKLHLNFLKMQIEIYGSTDLYILILTGNLSITKIENGKLAMLGNKHTYLGSGPAAP